jgi:Na+-transporting NADH:ubiquinone oxidoreductase subunit C
MIERRDSLGRTLGIAAGVALLCSLLVSTAVYLLRPIQQAHTSIDRNRAILAAAGLFEAEAAVSDREIAAGFLDLDVRIVDLETGQFTGAVDAASYDFRAAADDPRLRVGIADERDVAGLDTRPRYMPVYVLQRDGQIERIVLPIYAQGMWSTIYGFVGLAADMSTIIGVDFYEHGETPGIGDRIENPAWQAQWSGKELFGQDRMLRFRIAADADAAASRYRVDSITGATVTASAVGSAMRYWFSDAAYGPLLERLRRGEREGA